eukprot:2428029-Alexandrium_andersonii.AAC.1
MDIPLREALGSPPAGVGPWGLSPRAASGAHRAPGPAACRGSACPRPRAQGPLADVPSGRPAPGPH